MLLLFFVGKAEGRLGLLRRGRLPAALTALPLPLSHYNRIVKKMQWSSEVHTNILYDVHAVVHTNSHL